MKKICLGFLLLLSACAQFEPFVDSRREAGRSLPVGQSTPDRVAICYNPLWSDEQKVEKLSVEACAQTKRKPQFDDRNYFKCSLMLPSTIFYKCV